MRALLLSALIVGLALPVLADLPAEMEELGTEAPGVAATPEPLSGRSMAMLLVAESTGDLIAGFDPYDGTFLGHLITGYAGFNTPINAVQGPDGNLYVSDQISDAVFVFDPTGAYLYTYADAGDGLNNIRGIDFRDGELFITSGDDYVARFDGPHSRLPDFINDGTDPFDIYFLPDGSALLSDIQGTTDNVRLYDALGVFQAQLFSVNFPEQIQADPELPGAFLNVGFSDNTIRDFELSGAITASLPFSSGRGIYRLGNGNLLATNGDGVHVLHPATGAILQTVHAGSGRFIELYQTGSSVPASQGRLELQLEASPLCSGQLEIRLSLPRGERVDVAVYEPSGRRVIGLWQASATGGEQRLSWDGTRTDGTPAASGVYFILARAEGASAARRVVWTR